ncbi:putative extracellular serine-rich protein [Diaporthe ampelina]|uniref:Putative extracellular serine-rich protein n=1 Tax=Diaporthe ampelina TaxID=1214573 RepID=A0A0G2HMV0_9PEZI|nr:putative extracellular serine-rich protein [Diaporthe ampelina]
MQFTTAALAVMAGVASAQKVQVVTVSTANNSLVYTPDNIKANPGEMVQFQFVAGNHTVTQSTFDQPCTPISTVQSNVTGFHSGYQPAAASKETGMIPTYTLMINDSKPIWLYCAQGKHCQSGMVMVINENTSANASRSLTEFKTLAAQAQSNTAPSGGSTTGGTTGTGTGTESGTSASPSASSPGQTTAAGSMVKVGSSLGLAAAAAAFLLL